MAVRILCWKMLFFTRPMYWLLLWYLTCKYHTFHNGKDCYQCLSGVYTNHKSILQILHCILNSNVQTEIKNWKYICFCWYKVETLLGHFWITVELVADQYPGGGGGQEMGTGRGQTKRCKQGAGCPLSIMSEILWMIAELLSNKAVIIIFQS
jgi:hypothetical protein